MKQRDMEIKAKSTGRGLSQERKKENFPLRFGGKNQCSNINTKIFRGRKI